MGVNVKTIAVFQSVKMQRLIFDGVATAFILTTLPGDQPNIAVSSDLLVSLDGVIQDPDIAYTASGDVIVFTTAPSADSSCFIVWWSHL